LPKEQHKFPYQWCLKNKYPAKGITKHNLKVFGTFLCGGGSSMGYKLAGYNHLGGIEIDKKLTDVYKTNHNPKYFYNEDIRDFIKRDNSDLPKELFDLDILDGSPPCSSFSMSGNRGKDWNKKKKFREGQTEQKLDDLFFEYIKLAKKLQPKVIIAENVKGLIQGNAKAYVYQINKAFIDTGYKVQLFLLNAASMGVPQKRERVFFICRRKELKFPDLKLFFDEPGIVFGKIEDKTAVRKNINNSLVIIRWANTLQGENPKAKSGNTFGFIYKASPLKVFSTIVAGSQYYHYLKPELITDKEFIFIGSFPLDYDFKNIEPKYLIGMSVPPIMMAQISNQIYLQWFKKQVDQ